MKFTHEYFYQRYIVDNLSIKQISQETQLTKDQVKGRLRRFGIRKTKFKLTDKVYDDKDWLYHQYIELEKGYTCIANELGVSYSVILSRILHFGWKVRGHKDIDKGAPRRGKKHSESSLEKIRNTRQKNRIITKCNYCNQECEFSMSVYEKSKLKFCNRNCFRKYQIENRVVTENITDSAEYKNWRLCVYKRDGYRCKMPKCCSQSRDIAAHHIYPKRQYPEKQFEVANGITLCRSCHERTYGKEEKFINRLVRIVQKMDN